MSFPVLAPLAIYPITTAGGAGRGFFETLVVHVPVETNFWNSDEAVMLGELSGDRDAWRFVIRLWAWGLETDRVSGVLNVPAWKIAEASGYRGDPDQWVDWLKTSRLLVPKRGGLYMSGWSRMKRFFKERKRLRDYRKRKKVELDAIRDRAAYEARTRTVLGNTSPSPSPSPSLKHTQSVRALPLETTKPTGLVRIFEHWRERHPDQFLMPHSGLKEWCDAERRVTQDGLTIEDLCLAIDGIHMDDWEGRPRNLQLKHVVKSLDAAQRFIGIARGADALTEDGFVEQRVPQYDPEDRKLSWLTQEQKDAVVDARKEYRARHGKKD